jgi:dCTP deaminase
MPLIDRQIKELCLKGLVDPFDESLINPASLDIRIGTKLLLMKIEEDDFTHKDLLKGLKNTRQRGGFHVVKHFISWIEKMVVWKEIDLSRFTKEDPYWLFPDDRILVDSLETFNIPEHICGQFRLKSSRGREFYEHLEAGWIDNGWHGSKLTMEIENRSLKCLPIYQGLRMGQIIFFESDIPDKTYRVTGRYNNDQCVHVSKD